MVLLTVLLYYVCYVTILQKTTRLMSKYASRKKIYLKNYGDNYKIYIQGVLKMAYNIYVTRIYVEYQTKNSNLNLVSDE
jgi:hypothetical protein